MSLVRPTPKSRAVREKAVRSQEARAEASAQAEHATFRGRWLPWLFLLPTLLVLGVFSYSPAARTLRLSVFRANLIVGNEQYVGLQNFAELLSSPVYHQVILQTLTHCRRVHLHLDAQPAQKPFIADTRELQELR